MTIQEKLFSLHDEKYAAFSAKLIPTVEADRFIGVRSPQLRALAKDLKNNASEFLGELPHRYHEENMLHAYLLCIARDYATIVEETERFLPYIDNWAVCDSLAPRAFARHKAELLPRIREWMASEHEYTVRFGIGTLMRHYLDADFRPEDLWRVAAIDREEYYIRMMQAWYFATALAKQYDAIIPYIEQKKLDPWTHSKAIQKAIESYRITPEQKEYLRTFRLHKPL